MSEYAHLEHRLLFRLPPASSPPLTEHRFYGGRGGSCWAKERLDQPQAHVSHSVVRDDGISERASAMVENENKNERCSECERPAGSEARISTSR